MNDLNDPRIKKLLAQLTNRPETLSSMDVAPETDDSADFAIQEPDSEYEAPSDIQQAVGQATESSDKMIAGLPNKQYQADPKIMEMMNRLKSGQPMEPEVSEQDNEEVIQDPQAPEEVRRAAIERVRKKYLGQ